MADDRQTHSMPEDDEGVARGRDLPRLRLELKRSPRYAPRPPENGGASLHDALRRRSGAHVRRHARLQRREGDGDATLETLAAMGYAHPERAFETLRAWHEGRYRAMRSEGARERLVGAGADDPGRPGRLAGPRFGACALRRVPRAPAGRLPPLLDVCQPHPELFDLITEIMGLRAPSRELAGTPADVARQRPQPRVLRPRCAGRRRFGARARDIGTPGLVRVFYQREFGVAEMKAELADEALRARDLQDFLDAERRWANDKIFHIGVHMLRGLLFPSRPRPRFQTLPMPASAPRCPSSPRPLPPRTATFPAAASRWSRSAASAAAR